MQHCLKSRPNRSAITIWPSPRLLSMSRCATFLFQVVLLRGIRSILVPAFRFSSACGVVDPLLRPISRQSDVLRPIGLVAALNVCAMNTDFFTRYSLEIIPCLLKCLLVRSSFWACCSPEHSPLAKSPRTVVPQGSPVAIQRVPAAWQTANSAAATRA